MEGNEKRARKYFATLADLATLTGNPIEKVVAEFDEQELYRYGRRKVGVPPSLVRSHLQSKGVNYSFKVIAHINLRGGIGKTTSAITSASRAAQYGFKTCILDMDPQGSASLVFDVIPEKSDSIFCDIWKNPGEMVVGSLKQIDESLYILPSSLDNSLLDFHLSNPVSQKTAMSGVCDELKANGFDLAIIDCPPSLGAGVISSICAADTVVIPVGSDPFSFRGLELTFLELTSICSTFVLGQPDVKILLSKFDRREKISLDALNTLQGEYREYLIPGVIRTSTEYSKALDRGETVFASTTKSVAREDYDMYVRYLFGLDMVFKNGEDA
jgi:chromosome partitioning protein